jgi:hypothetical protein
VQKELGRTVVINDDGSAPRMYDLRIGPPDRPEFAIECIGAVDPIFTETWNIGPARGALSLPVEGDWNVEIAATARVNTIRKKLQRLLQKLERRGIHNIDVDYRLEWADATLFNEFESLKVTRASCYCRHGSGKVHLSMPGTGGAVDYEGNQIPKWLADFLGDRSRADVLSKLQESGANARHVFVIATLGGTPWPVESYLMGELDQIPSKSPELPAPITAAWVAMQSGRKGLYWDGSTWRVVETCCTG